MRFRSRTSLLQLHSCCRSAKKHAGGECVDRRYATAGYSIFFVVALLLQVLTGAAVAGDVVPESLSNSGASGDGDSAVSDASSSMLVKDKLSRAVAESSKHLAGKYGKFSLQGEVVYYPTSSSY
ncbi:unnamed protein product [Ceratitis capitata]|uniref:(Mediterranean fruit fly) hypothetical protein n=1 Tax=Ceratitis capitata TaxID=7213 RepID=A0A811UIX8_CERCA|nr:unnamed protein product [Ceratitis capitata]